VSTCTIPKLSAIVLLTHLSRILEVAPPKVGEDKPAYVRAEISIDMSRLPDDVRRDWDALRPDDVVFFLAVRGSDEAYGLASRRTDTPLADQYGLKALRTAEVIQILDKDGRVIRDPGQMRGMNSQKRRIHVKLDPAMYRVCQ